MGTFSCSSLIVSTADYCTHFSLKRGNTEGHDDLQELNQDQFHINGFLLLTNTPTNTPSCLILGICGVSVSCFFCGNEGEIWKEKDTGLIRMRWGQGSKWHKILVSMCLDSTPLVFKHLRSEKIWSFNCVCVRWRYWSTVTCCCSQERMKLDAVTSYKVQCTWTHCSCEKVRTQTLKKRKFSHQQHLWDFKLCLVCCLQWPQSRSRSTSCRALRAAGAVSSVWRRLASSRRSESASVSTTTFSSRWSLQTQDVPIRYHRDTCRLLTLIGK